MGNEYIMFYVIVPIFNVEHYLRKCLDSLLVQSYVQWRAILINDGSTDSSKAIANEYVQSDNRFILLSQDNQGQAIARNAGLEYVKELISTMPPPPLGLKDSHQAHYIVFLDSDDYLESDALAHSYNILKQEGVDVLVYSIIAAREPYTYARVKFDYTIFPLNLAGLYTPKDLITALGGYHIITTIGGFVCKASMAFENNLAFIPRIIYEDIAFCTQAVLQCKTLYISHKQIYNYVFYPNSTMRQQLQKDKWIKITYSYYITLRFFKQSLLESNDDIFKEYCHRACLDMAKRLMKSLQFVGYIQELGFSKQDLAPFLPYIKGKYRLCYHFPRIYGLPKRLRLTFQALWERLVVGKV